MTTIRVVAAAILSFSCVLGAQQKYLEAIGVEKSHAFGAFNFLGDLNGDGYEDLGVETWLATHTWNQITFVSGKDGKLLRKLVSNSWYGVPLPAGDWNADGVSDYVARLPGSSEIRNGKDDRLLALFARWSDTAQFAIAVADVELDGDGKPDLVLINVDRFARQESGLYAVSNNKKRLWFIGMPWVDRGWTTSAVGDVDGDGCDDIGVHDGWATNNTIFVVSGKTGAMLYKVTGERPSDLLGSGEITSCGDVDGDGRDDFAASGQASFITDSVVRVFSGRTGKALFTWREPEPNSSGFGISIASGHDLDQDGVNDLIVGDMTCLTCKPRGAGGEAHVFSLRTGKKIAVVRPDRVTKYTNFGGRVRMGRARPGNPFPVFAVLDAYRFIQSRPGALTRISFYHMLPTGITPFGSACKGTLRQQPTIGINDNVGPGLRAHLSNAPPATTALFLLGLSDKRWGNATLPLALDPLGFTGCKLFTSIDLICPARTGTSGIDKGYAFVDVPSLTTRPLHGQWLVLGSGPHAPGATSSALRWKR